MFRVLLVDDEPLALKHLLSLLSTIPDVDVVAQTKDGSEVLHLIKETQPNLVFLDINIGEYNGLEIAEQIELLYPTIQIVFITAYTEHAIDAFELNAVDYLLKPVSNTRLVKTFSRLRQEELTNLPEFKNQNNVNSSILIKENSIYINAFKQGEIKVDEDTSLIFRTKKAEELLFLLWHFKETPLSREQIIDALWPGSDLDKSVTLLHSTLYQLRKVLLENGFQQPIQLQNKLYTLQTPCNSDVESFLMLLEKPITEHNLEKLMTLYKGAYFEQNEFNWALPTQEIIEQKWISFITKALDLSDILSTSLLTTILAKITKDALFNPEWVVANLHFFGRTKQMKQLSDTFEDAKIKWNKELGLDLPQKIISVYSSYLNQ